MPSQRGLSALMLTTTMQPIRVFSALSPAFSAQQTDCHSVAISNFGFSDVFNANF